MRFASAIAVLALPVASWTSWYHGTKPQLIGKTLSKTGARASANVMSLAVDNAELGVTLAERAERVGALWGWALPAVVRYYANLAKLTFDPSAPAPGTPERDEEWAPLHRRGAAEVKALIEGLRGFYVKSGQFVATRRDLFPLEYTTSLEELTDRVAPMEPDVVRKVVESELGKPLEEVFTHFDMNPLGSASIAQVHRAQLKDGGNVVAVKVQRPGVSLTMMDDVANIKVLTKILRDATPVDYFTVMCEIETQVKEEFDFTIEAASMRRVGSLWPGGSDAAPMRIPQPCAKFSPSPRCLIMDFIDGVPLSQFAESQDPKPSRAEEELFGQLLLRALTDSIGRQLFQEGFFHGDPHPGNIMVTDGGAGFSLIDFGQTKQIPSSLKKQLAQAVLLLAEAETWRPVGDPLAPRGARRGNVTALAQLVRDIGLKYAPGTPETSVAAIAVWLFDTKADYLPGGLSNNELSLDSPVACCQSFPSEIVFVARSTLLIRGIAELLGIEWSLAKEWAPAAAAALNPDSKSAAAAKPVEQMSWVRRVLTKPGKILQGALLSTALALEKRLPPKASAFFRRALATLLLRVVKLRERFFKWQTRRKAQTSVSEA